VAIGHGTWLSNRRWSTIDLPDGPGSIHATPRATWQLSDLRIGFATLEAQNATALPRLMLITVRSVFGVVQYVFMETNGPCRRWETSSG
jgi:hypothetical protein